ncbi:MAG: deoxyribonuclease IV [Phycisphaerae bacterium]
MQKNLSSSAAPGSQTHRFGAHLSIAGGMENAIVEAISLDCGTVQVFVKNQRQWRASPLTDEQIAKWKAALPTNGFGPIVAHATYLINLASSDDELWEKSANAFQEELRRCDALGIAYLVVHPGSPVAGTREEGISRVSAALNGILKSSGDIRTMPLLENTAGQGKTLGRTFADLGEILAGVKKSERVGVCIDSCHAFAAGYDLRDSAAYDRMIQEMDTEFGVNRVRCWHLNDSKTDLGSRRDRHEHIGEGKIGVAGFQNILSDKRFVGVPMILETPKEDANDKPMDAINLQRLREIADSVSKTGRKISTKSRKGAKN